MKRILVFNAGSSSIKYKVFRVDEHNKLEVDQKGGISSIGLANGPKSHKIALNLLFQGFGWRKGQLSQLEDLTAIGHRGVHGGTLFQQTTLIDKKVIGELKKYNKLAPLHNPIILDIVSAIFNNSGKGGHRKIPNYLVFDTEFYHQLPDVAKIYPIPYSFYEKHHIRRFGFHGISHEHVLREVEEKYPIAKKIISIHLGAGSSITAINNNQVVDTSMGFTPMEGLMMTTRSGDIDPGIIFYLMREFRMSYRKVENMLDNQSGIKGIVDITSDMKDLLYLAGYEVEDDSYTPHNKIVSLKKEYSERAKLALEIFCYKIKKYIGAYWAILEGVDIIAFTGEVGYGSSSIRKLILNKMDKLIDQVKIISVPTDEEYLIAKKVLREINK